MKRNQDFGFELYFLNVDVHLQIELYNLQF